MNLLPWFDTTTDPLLRLVQASVAAQGAIFLLTAARLAGFIFVGALLGKPILTWPMRVGLVILLTLIVAPNLPTPESPPIQPAAHEVPAQLNAAWDADTSHRSTNIVVATACELAIGASLGLAIAVFLSGLKLAGEWIDRHSGLGLGSVLNPDYSAGGSAPAEMTWLLSISVILVLQPVNGHLLAVRYVLDTFHAIPLGSAPALGSFTDLIKALVQQSLILGLRIAMPFVVAMSLLEMTLGWARRASRFDLTSTAVAFRASAALLILAATLPGIQEAVNSSLQESLKAANDNLLAHQP